MNYNSNSKGFTEVQSAVQFDSGLRAYMAAVYKNMAIALLITAVVSMIVASSPMLLQMIFGTPLSWIVMLAPVFLSIYMGAKFNSMSQQAVQTLLYIYSGTMGLSLSFIFLLYTGESIARIFLVTASMFGAMSIYGYSTKKDLTAIGSFLIMGVLGIIVASLVNLFMQSSALNFAISIISVLLFTGLTAYDTQRIKDVYFQVSGSNEMAEKISVYGALTLYMDFINLFVALLRLFGDRKSE